MSSRIRHCFKNKGKSIKEHFPPHQAERTFWLQGPCGDEEAPPCNPRERQLERSCLPSARCGFFNQGNILYGTLTEFCTKETCTEMSSGTGYQYKWADYVKVKKPIACSSPRYIECLMDWIKAQLDDETVFPQRMGDPLPQNFRSVVMTIFRRLFRMYAHIYHTHFNKVEFDLIRQEQLAPLGEMVDRILNGGAKEVTV